MPAPRLASSYEQAFICPAKSANLAQQENTKAGHAMTTTAIVSILCGDSVGLVAAITGRLFDLGANLGDTTFAVLGGGAEFTAICEFPGDVPVDSVEDDLRRLRELMGAKVTVSRFDLEPVHGPSGHVTHHIDVSGGDRPGLIARLCEVFIQFKANIVRLNAVKAPAVRDGQYVIRFSVNIPEATTRSCLATVANTAGEMQMNCQCREVGSREA